MVSIVSLQIRWAIYFTLQARNLMTRLGDQSQLRYPDVVHRDRIPSDMYNEDDAKYAIEQTKRVIELANEAIQ